jgi:hypothetical protein
MTHRCGLCFNWMKLPLCPREHQDKDGYHRGPNCNGPVCGRYSPDPQEIEAIQRMENEEARRLAECQEKEARVIAELVRDFLR